MSTKTMRLPPRRFLTVDQPRRNGEQTDAVKRPSTAETPWFKNSTTSDQAGPARAAESTRSNQLLAGYMAYEFLTSRTLFGEPLEPPARAAESRKRYRAANPSPAAEEKRRRYTEVCDLLKSGDTHFPGVVNPSQLAGILRL